ncbi:MAG: hypothetical protein ACLPN5_11240 [Roseiarcus sp.]
MAYIIPDRWNLDEIAITLVDELSTGVIATIRVEVVGIALLIMGEIVEDRERLVVTGVHVSSRGVKPNEIGLADLRQLAQAVMEVGGYDEIVVQGALRTTGAHPGHRPRPIRFARDPVAASEG